MNDVLPKPFTKEGLLSMLEHQLAHLTRPKGQQQQQQQQHQQQQQGSVPPHLNFTNPQHGMHLDQPLSEPPNTGNTLKYSVSPVPSKSPGTAGLYGPVRSPTDMTEDVSPQVQPPGGMDDPGGYVGMMGGYMSEDPTNQGHGHSSYHSPVPGTRRVAEDDMYGAIKKQRY
jgi:hypothetical protein